MVFLQQVARQVAVAVDNAHNFAQAQSVQKQLKDERDRLSLLLDVNNAVVSVLDLHELLKAVSDSLRRLVPHEYASLSLYDAESQTLQIHALDFPVSKGMLQEGLAIPVEGSPTGMRDTNPSAGIYHAQGYREIRFRYCPAHTRRRSQVSLLPAIDFPSPAFGNAGGCQPDGRDVS